MNPVVHFELPCEDRDRAAKFYQSAFGWQVQLMGPEMGNYVLVTTASKDSRPDAHRGAINGGIFPKQKEGPQHPSIVIGVDDVEAATKRIADAGGKVVSEVLDIPGVGRYAQFTDTEGNQNSILQPMGM